MRDFIYADGVFEGGGIRGIGIVGALKSFQEHGYVWKRVAGTSVGAIIAALVIAGYKPNELEEIISNMDFIKFLDKDSVNKIPVVGTALGIIKDKGIYSGEYFESWIKKLLENKGISTFKDLMENGKSKLKVVVSDITKKQRIIIPDDLYLYNVDPMNFSVARAIRMSISIPFYFKPVEFVYEGGKSYMVDGGITYNYPIDVFDEDINIRPIIGFKFQIGKEESFTSQGHLDTMSFLFDIASTMGEYSCDSEISEKNKERTVFIPAYEVKSTEFDISKEKTKKLFNEGYEAAETFLRKRSFKKHRKRFVNKHRFKMLVSKVLKEKK